MWLPGLLSFTEPVRDFAAFGIMRLARKGESSIYTLADIKIRSDASYAKDYLNGKYGAIPVVELGANEENGAFGG